MQEQKNKPCYDCGGRFPPECMDFDHVRGEKSFSVGTGRTRSQEALTLEIAKCDIVCANCHRIRTKVRGKSRKLTKKPRYESRVKDLL